jgi:hypothetical protein
MLKILIFFFTDEMGKIPFSVSIASIFRWRIFEIEKLFGFSHNAHGSVAKARKRTVPTTIHHLKMAANNTYKA